MAPNRTSVPRVALLTVLGLAILVVGLLLARSHLLGESTEADVVAREIPMERPIPSDPADRAAANPLPVPHSSSAAPQVVPPRRPPCRPHGHVTESDGEAVANARIEKLVMTRDDGSDDPPTLHDSHLEWVDTVR